jgi:hypothetical protein
MPTTSSAQAINTALNNLNAATNITLTKPLIAKDITISGGSKIKFNSGATFEYDDQAAATAHRAALGITSSDQSLTSILNADSAGVVNSLSYVDSGLELSLTVGKWIVTGTAVQTAGGAGSGSRMRFSLSRSSSATGVVFYANGATASTATSLNILGTSSIFFGGLVEALTAYYNWSFVVDITNTTTLKVQYAQAVARTGETTRVKINSHITARKL